MTSVDLYLAIVDEARKYLLKQEIGNNRGDFVDSINKEIHNPEGSPWCAAFVGHCLSQIEKRYGVKTNIFVSGHVLTMWNKTEKHFKYPYPLIGHIVCWKQSGTTNGHTGIVTEVDEKMEWFKSIEGNTSSNVDDREGQGVYEKVHRMDTSGSTLKLLGFIKPFGCY